MGNLRSKPVLLRQQLVLVNLSSTPFGSITGTLLPLVRYYNFRELLLTYIAIDSAISKIKTITASLVHIRPIPQQ